MEKDSKKVNFFNRIKKSVFKLEDYSDFLEEKFSVSIKYFLLLILLITVLISVVQAVIFTKKINKGYEYFVNELPEFEYKDEKLVFSNNVDAYDEEFKFYFFANTDENLSEEKIKDYRNKVYNSSNGIIVLKDKLIYIEAGSELEYNFKYISEDYGIKEIDKQGILEKYTDNLKASVIFTFFITSLLSMYIVNVVKIVMDVLVLTLFGMIAARICGIKINIVPMTKIVLHAITFPILITGVYIISLLLTGFVIKQYNVMYLLISYVYIVAAIMMLKTDLIKQREELIKIEEVRKEVHEELEEENNKDKEKDKKEENDNKEDENKGVEERKPEINPEPDGSEI